MKILFTTGSKESILNYTLELCACLQKFCKAQVGIITSESPSAKVSFPSSVKVFHSGINTIWQNDFGMFVQNLESLNKFSSNIIKDFNPDFVHFNHIGLDPCGKANLLHFHDDILNQLKWQEKRGRNFPYLKMHKQFRHFVINSINNYDCLMATSKFCALNIIKTYNPQKPFKVISNSSIPYELQETGFKRSIITVLDEYNRKNSLKMLHDLKMKLPDDIKIFVVSNRPQSVLDNNKIKFIPLHDKKEVNKAFLDSSIYLALGNWDYFNYYPINASLRNCSILANDIPFYREYWQDAGILFERNNMTSLVKNINNLIENPTLNQKVAHNCRIKALSCFSLKSNTSHYFNLYNELLRQKNKTIQKV